MVMDFSTADFSIWLKDMVKLFMVEKVMVEKSRIKKSQGFEPKN